MASVVLDSEPLSILARAHGGEDLDRIRAALTVAARRGMTVRVPTVVLVELYRGTRSDAGIDTAMRRFGVRAITTGAKTARIAGGFLHRDRLDTCHLADAVVVATAAGLGGGVVVTGDPGDITALATGNRNIRIQAI